MTKTSVTRRQLLKTSAVVAGAGAFLGPWKYNRVYAAGTDKPIKIGITSDASGQYANSGASDRRGMHMAIAEYNAKGGVLGRKIETTHLDTETTPATGSRVAERMINREEVGFLIANCGERVGADKFAARFAYRGQQIGALLDAFVDQMRDQLGIRIRLDLGTTAFEGGPKLAVVLDDPVMHDHDATRAMGMGISLRGLTVGCPTGVADTEMSLQGLLAQRAFEVDQLALRAANFENAALEDGNTGGVIAAILETAKAINKHINRLMLKPNISNNPTHIDSSRPRLMAPLGVANARRAGARLRFAP